MYLESSFDIGERAGGATVWADVMFLSELREVVMSCDGATAEVEITDSGEGKTLYKEELRAGSDGNIRMAGVDALLRPYFSGPLMELSVTVDGVSVAYQITVIYTDRSMTVSAGRWCANRYLTAVEKQRSTIPGRLELLSLLAEVEVQVYADCRYWRRSTRSIEVVRRVVGSVHGFEELDVSPLQWVDNEEFDRELTGYDIIAGGRRMSYRIADWYNLVPAEEKGVIFPNCFGAREVLYLRGNAESEPEYSYNQALIEGMTVSYGVQERDVMKLSTGPMEAWMEAPVRDLARRGWCRALEGQRVGEKLVIEESKVKLSRAAEALNEVEYSMVAECQSARLGMSGERVFDETFDDSYE